MPSESMGSRQGKVWSGETPSPIFLGAHQPEETEGRGWAWKDLKRGGASPCGSIGIWVCDRRFQPLNLRILCISVPIRQETAPQTGRQRCVALVGVERAWMTTLHNAEQHVRRTAPPTSGAQPTGTALFPEKRRRSLMVPVVIVSSSPFRAARPWLWTVLRYQTAPRDATQVSAVLSAECRAGLDTSARQFRA
ncbi:hypothetical protein VUR80DRAFT_8492 [Thermomyces stellatus]